MGVKLPPRAFLVRRSIGVRRSPRRPERVIARPYTVPKVSNLRISPASHAIKSALSAVRQAQEREEE